MKKLFMSVALCALCIGTIAIAAASADLAVTGRVTDSTDGLPFAGVAVAVKNTKTGVVTDAEGRYSISAKKGDVLIYSYLGFKTENRTVKAAGVIDVALQPDDLQIDDVVVTGSRSIIYKKVKTGALATAEASIQEEYAAPDNNAVMSFTMPVVREEKNTEEYNSFRENRFISVAREPLSTFALEVDGASYSNVRRMISAGQMPPRDAVRVEEFVNYHSYNYPKPTGDRPLAVDYEIGPCPWNGSHQLVRIGIKAREIPSDKLPKANFVFLIDVSGSMYSALPLVKASIKLLVNNLRDEDRAAIVVYAGAAGLVLPSTSGSDKQKIREAVDNLSAGGSTAGGAGIRLAYQVAHQNLIKDGNNRVILATDGDFNVGVSSNAGLEELIERERKEAGVFLTVLGYGMGNYKDSKMQTLAEKGNGNYAYIDNMQEANRFLVREFGGTVCTVAKDVKLQVEFNPAQVESYRLVGYESRLLRSEDFNDDTKDAGEIGAGNSVTALYEIVPTGSEKPSVDPLRYRQQSVPGVAEAAIAGGTVSNELMNIKIRYKAPDADVSSKFEIPVVWREKECDSDDFRFAAAAAMFAQLLRESDSKGDATYGRVVELARLGLGDDPNGYRREFIRLAETAGGMQK
ncbi:MAG: von Willebrand factor type A domain-containing protein [Rikenellaceae bacterium]|jgi:Ca-activated chloride channel family protein|nr:von Willebrand factor type A domain-containing protein [Rikenellaceae bacterium]